MLSMSYVLRRLRLTHKQAARILRASPRTVERWAQGRSPAPRAAVRLLITRAARRH